MLRQAKLAKADFRERRLQVEEKPIHSPRPHLTERLGEDKPLGEQAAVLYPAKGLLHKKPGQDPARESPAGLGMGLRLGERPRKKKKSRLMLPARKPDKGLSCASVEVSVNK